MKVDVDNDAIMNSRETDQGKSLEPVSWQNKLKSGSLRVVFTDANEATVRD